MTKCALERTDVGLAIGAERSAALPTSRFHLKLQAPENPISRLKTENPFNHICALHPPQFVPGLALIVPLERGLSRTVQIQDAITRRTAPAL